MSFMKTKMPLFNFIGMIAIGLVLLMQTCNNTSTEIYQMNQDFGAKVDSLENVISTLEEGQMTEQEVRDNMQEVMLDFLIYEDDLDKGKISLSDIKQKIEED